jgi:hypothetical protein
LYGKVEYPSDVFWVGEQLRHPRHEDAPAGVVDAVDVVDLHTDHRSSHGGIELGALVGGKDDVPVDETDIDRESDRDALHTEHHPADSGAMEELQTFGSVQLDQGEIRILR